MSALTIHPDPTPRATMHPSALAVHVEGRRRRDMHVESWRTVPAPEFGKAKLTLAMASRRGPDHRLEHLAALPGVGRRLQIRLPGARPRVLFDGFVTKHVARVGPDVEQLDIEVEDALARLLGAPIAGRWQASGAVLKFVENEQCLFNDGRESLASFATHAVGARSCRVFQPAPPGQPWSVPDILGYLLAAHVPAEIACPSLEELEGLASGIWPGRVSLTGLTVCEAIARIASLGGLAVRGSLNWAEGALTRGLVFYRPGRIGRRRPVRLQRHGEKLDSRRSDLWKGQLVVGRRPARRGILVLGDWKRYESSFELARAWEASLESYRYSSFVCGDSPDWPAVKDVFRKWALNEAGAYSGPPCNLPVFDFSSISEQDFFLSTPRRFKPCLSLGRDGRSLGVVVEVSLDDGAHWKPYGGPIRVSTDECALYLAGDALPGEYFQAALSHEARLRVTATVVSDRRIAVQLAGESGCGLEVVQMLKARWAKVHSGSIFCQRSDLPAPAERDDTACLMQLARNFSESDAGAVEAEMTLGWLDPNWNVGDIVDRIAGRELSLATFPGSAPCVQAVEHRCGEEWQTRLTLRG